MTLTKLFTGALVALMLAACGGGTKNEAASADTTATVPADATAPEAVPDAQADTTAVTALTYVTSFKVATPEKIVLEQYASISGEGTEAPQKTVEITDGAALAEIVALVNKLPDSGQIMVKWAEVPVLRVKLVYAEGSQYFSFFQQSVKTPATNFYAGKKPAEEKQLYDLLAAKLAH
ncbi:hypothetical protein [Dawidia soli]|uniref:Uncharacterized protein n=1 Tax=Dawidia soli TaxID=2782352 RepID=A0AAP2GL38_9BACT|nr:hypothetical protein [Dawidia soli]MBT1689708.1 hypothetical protein [Dawidia soli]